MQVTLSDKGAELAELALKDGHYPSIEAAVEHALALLVLETSQEQIIFEWDDAYAAEVNRKLDEAEDDIRAGRIVRADDAFWERMRERIRAVGRASGNLG